MKLIPYVCYGHNGREFTLSMVKMLSKHAYAIEIGLPFSDPIADGPVIQRAYTESLAGGANYKDALSDIKMLRAAGVKIPIYIMAYYNIIYSAGIGNFLSQAKAAGVNGLVIPDLPFGQEPGFRARAKAEGISMINFLSMNTPEQRAREIIGESDDFIYLVSSFGTTGAREGASPESIVFVKKIRAMAEKGKKLFVGFGVSGSEVANEYIGAGADGVIVGSKLIEIYGAFMKGGVLDSAGALAAAEKFVLGFK